MTFHGTLADINTALATATYTPPANYNGPATITLSATDMFGGIVATGTGAATSDSDVINVTVTAQNDTPVVAVRRPSPRPSRSAVTINAAWTSATPISTRATAATAIMAGRSSPSMTATAARMPRICSPSVRAAPFTVNGANLEAGGLIFATFTGGNGAPRHHLHRQRHARDHGLGQRGRPALQYTYTGDTPPMRRS